MNQNFYFFFLFSFIFFQKNEIQAQDALVSPTYYVEKFNNGSASWSFKQQSGSTFKWALTNKGAKNIDLNGAAIPAGAIDPPLKKNTSDYWMILDAFAGGKASPANIDAWLISPRFDCSEFNEVYLRFNTMFRRFDAAEELLVGVSTDSINFKFEEVFKDIQIGQFSDEKFTYLKTKNFVSILKLNDIAVNKTKVWLAFRYKSPSFSSFSGNYSWQIDDIELFNKNPVPTCDFKIYDDACAIPPFRVIPMSQLDSISFLMDVKNKSLLAKKDVELQVSVEDMTSKTLLFQDKKIIPNVDAGETFKAMLFDKKFLPNPVKKNYRITYKVKGSCDDEFENDNTYHYYFDVTEDIFQKEKEPTRKVSPDNFSSKNTSWSYGNHFYIKNAKDLEAKEIVYMLDNAEELNGDSLIAELYKWNNQNDDDEAQLSELQLVASGRKKADGSSNQKYIYSLPLLDAQKQKVTLEDNSDYLAVIHYKNMSNNGETTMQMLVSDTLFYDACVIATAFSGKPLYNSVVRIGNEPSFNTNGFQTPMTPVVRLVLNKKIVSSKDLALESDFALFPNPVQDDFQIKSNQTSELMSYEIYNTFGQMLLKNQCFADEKINVNGLLSGIYFVKINGKTLKMLKE